MIEDSRFKISVILPVYNSDASLHRCINSILSQSYSNIELVIVDDGSTDGSSQICDDFAACDSRVKVFHTRNMGVYSARNTGLQVVTGELIMWVDSDDWIDADWVEKFAKVIKENDVDIAIAGEVACALTGRDILANYLLDRLRRTMWVTCAKAELYENIEFENYAIGEDVLFLCKLLNKAQSCYSIPKPAGYHYADNPNSVSRIASLKNKSDWPDRARAELNFIEHVAPELSRHAKYDIMRGASIVYRSIRQMPFSIQERQHRKVLLSELRTLILRCIIRLPYREMNTHNYRQIVVTFRDLLFK